MPDIEMCDNQKCDKRNECYRAKAVQSYMQSWCIFNDGAPFNSKCNYFIQFVKHDDKPIKVNGKF